MSTDESQSPARRRADVPGEEDDDFEVWLAEVLERADPAMAWLGILFALLVGYELAVELSDGAARVLMVIGWVIWAVFLAELLAHLYVAPHRRRYLRRHWFQVLAVIVPTLRFLRFARLLRLGRALPAARVVTSSYRVAGTARRLLGSRLRYLLATTAVVIVAVAELGFLFEREGGHESFSGFGDAVLWAAGVVIAQQGDPVPESAAAHLVMIVGFAWGVVVFASIAGSVGAYFLEDRREREPA